MNDYNFFEPYKKQPEKFSYERVIWAAVVAAGIFLMVVLFFSNSLRLSIVDNQITDLDLQLSSADMQKKLKEVGEVENTMHQIENSAKKLNFLDILTAASQSFTYDIFSELNVKVPKNIFISNINYANRALSVSGYSESVENIALFTHQLSSAAIFDTVRVSNIIMDNENYSFDMVVTTQNSDMNPTGEFYNTPPTELTETKEEDGDAKSEDE